MNKTVLLTGGAGFIGSHTVEHVLKNTNWNIIILDRLSYAGNLNRITETDIWNETNNRVAFYYHDFRSKISGQKQSQLFNIFGSIDYVVHMGAESHVDRSIEDPYPFVYSNVLGTVNMLEFLRSNVDKIKKFVYISTDEVYGALEDQLHKENAPHNPSNPYSASKAAGEDFCVAYENTYDLPIIITNTMNCFGERQDVEKFVPKTINNILNGEEITIHCKMQIGSIVDISSRCWLHSRNHADAVLFLLENGKQGEKYNIVGERRSVYELAEKITKFLNTELKYKFEDYHSYRPGHDMHYGLDGTKMKELGWTPPMSLDDTLQSTIRWMVDNRGWL